MACAICETRKPKRFCPGVRGEISAICCGTEREVTVDCPLDCEYLIESRRHDKPSGIDVADLPNRDIQVTESMLDRQKPLLLYISGAMIRTAMETPGLVDWDMREALDALIRTYRTLQSGVFYESRPTNPLAAVVYEAVQQAVPEFRKLEQDQLGMTRTRDADVLAMLVFLQHFELDRNNGRKRSRAFIQTLGSFYIEMMPPQEPERGSSLVVP